MARRRYLPIWLAVSAIAGCSSSGSSTVCLSGRTGEICAEGPSSAVALTATGLMPGSEVVVESATFGSARFVVAADGTLDGAVGAVSVAAPATVRFDISAVDGDGTPIEGRITLDD